MTTMRFARPGTEPLDAAGWPCVREAGLSACVLTVSVQPNARQTEATGLQEGALRVRLAAQPVEGQANAALTAWLARELGLAKRDVRLRRGAAARHKQVEIDAPAAQVRAWLQRTLGSA
jgi:uncharacterized protein (TIGR00251 family)